MKISKTKKIFFKILLIPISGLILLWIIFFTMDIATGSYSFRRSFESIKPGISKDQVIDILGNPYSESKVPIFGDFIIYESPSGFEKGKIHYYLYWGSPGIANEAYSIGFDDNGKVVYAVYGSS